MNKVLSDLEDQLLVMDAQDGNTAAMDQLVRRWQKVLWHHACRLTADPEAAWDVTQQAWLGIIKGLGKLHDPANFRAWAYRITTNKAVNWIRERKADKEVTIEQLSEISQPLSKEIDIRELMSRLDLKKRLVLSLYYFDGLSVPDISMALMIPQGTVKSRLHAARNELKQLYEQEIQ